MDGIVAAVVTGVFALIGVFVSTRNQANKTRDAGLSQHTEQNGKLDQIITSQKHLDEKVEDNRRIAAEGLQKVSDRVENLHVIADTLFTMIVDLDNKVTKQADKTKPTFKKEVVKP
jgi:hypothetical protein